jgi:hypothetical protein
VIVPETLQPSRRDPPPGWTVETFERVTDALALALVAAVTRQAAGEARDPHAQKEGSSSVTCNCAGADHIACRPVVLRRIEPELGQGR